MSIETIHLGDDLYGIRSPFSRAVINACKTIPGMVWNAEEKVWVGLRDAVDATTKLMAAGGIRVAPLRDEPHHEAISGRHIVARRLPAIDKLRSYQWAGVQFLYKEKRAILADDMGLGKTLQALAAGIAVVGRTLIVIPNRAKHVWKEELRKSFGRTNGTFPKGRAPVALFTDIVIINYEILDAWKGVLSKWNPDVVIFDEAHNLMSETSQRTKAARIVSARATYVWGLTGTPLPNHIKDLYSIVETIRPGTFGDKFFNFGRRYCGGKQEEHPSRSVPGAKEKHWVFDGASNLDELRERLSYFLLRRTKSDVALELPRKTRQTIFIDVPGASSLLPSSNVGLRETRRLLDLSAAAKLPQVTSAIVDAAQEGARIVVFCYRKAVVESIIASLLSVGVRARAYHGDISQERRANILLDGASGLVDVMVATVDSAGDAIDLSWASTAIFAELSYEPFKLLQSEARLHRFGQSNPVQVIYYLARGTIDDLIANNVIGKLDSFADVGLTEDGGRLQGALVASEESMLERLYASIAAGNIGEDGYDTNVEGEEEDDE